MSETNITEIEVRYGKTVNLGDYNSGRIDLMIRMTIEPHITSPEIDTIMGVLYSRLKNKADKLLSD